MSALLAARAIEKTFAARTLFTGVSISVEGGERVALIGPNGAGKSTLLKILAGIEPTDGGEITARRGLRVAYVAQADEFPEGATALAATLGHLERTSRDGGLPHLHDHHELEQAAERAIRRAGLGAHLDASCERLSGGQRKRLSVARALACDPDLLLLDEPTNHLDIEGVAWLEETLRGGSLASIVVTHDRAFLEGAATRIVELSHAYPEGTFSVQGGFAEFLRRKEEFLEGQAKQMQSLSNEVREDLRWLSRGVKARRTRSKSRVEASHKRMEDLEALRRRNAPVRAAGIDFSSTDRQTTKLLVGRGLSKRYGDRTLFENLDLMLSPGDCLGLLGPNGAGKSTLIRLLAGEIESDPPTPAMLAEEAGAALDPPPGTPSLGSIRRAEGLRIVAFSQRRDELDPAMTLGEALSPVDSVNYRGRMLHIATWAEMFLFGKDRLRSPVRSLSGGEQARIHIARLMLEPADVLILDEPTNDLDLASLEVLEESIEEFPGAVVLVTHDRAMLDRLATRVLALDGRGGARSFADYAQWKSVTEAEAAAVDRDRPAVSRPRAAPAPTARKGLSYKEQRELAAIEPSIEAAESAVRALEEEMALPEVIADHRRFAAVAQRLADAQEAVGALYARWQELEAKRV